MKSRSATLLFLSFSYLGAASVSHAAVIGAIAGCSIEDWPPKTLPMQDCSLSTVNDGTSIERAGVANLESGHLATSSTVTNLEAGAKGHANVRASIVDMLTFSRPNSESFSGQIFIPIAGKFSGDVHLLDEAETVDTTFSLSLISQDLSTGQYGSFGVYTQLMDGQVSLAEMNLNQPFTAALIEESVSADSFSAILQLNFFWTSESAPFKFTTSIESGNRFDYAGSVSVDMFANQGIQFVLPDDVTMTSESGYLDIFATASPVSAPATFWLALLGAAGLVRKRRKSLVAES